MKVRPAKTFLGCCSLMLGIEAACAVTLLIQILTIAICSSTRPIKFAGVTISPTMQVIGAAWSFVGIPITIVGGVGALHRIGGNIRALFYYQALSFLGLLLWPVAFLASSSLCDLVVAPEVQNQGSAFICGFADSFVLSWCFMFGLTHAYIIYIIWSAAEDIRLFPNPELMRYEEALRDTRMPEMEQPTGPTPDMFEKARAAYAMPQPQGPPADVNRSGYGSGMGQPELEPGPISMGPRGSEGPGGVPQSFFPAPMSGVRFESNIA